MLCGFSGAVGVEVDAGGLDGRAGLAKTTVSSCLVDDLTQDL